MKRSILYLVTLTAFALAVIPSCKNDNEEELNPQPKPIQQQCDTTNITYAGTVSTILSDRCYDCHSTAVARKGVILDTYNGVKQQADNGKLIGVITHASGFPPMPQGGSKLSNCDINKITKWVNAGAPNN
jgi:uncharacterized membrane protein